MISLTPPQFSSGELLSAYELNALSECVERIQGAANAPTGVFVKTGVDQTWWMRRRFRYLHVAYSINLSGPSLDVHVDFGNSANAYYHNASVSYQWRTFDLDAVGGVAPGDFYSILVTRSGTNFDFQVEEIRESSSSTPAGAGGYTAPPTFTGSENPSQFLSVLQGLSATVSSLTAAVRFQPNAATLRPTDPTIFRLRRRQNILVVSVTVSGSAPEVDLYVNATKTHNNITTGIYTIDLAAVGVGVGSYYDFKFDRIAGYGIINYLHESPVAPAVAPPHWVHGEQVAGNLAKFQQYASALTAAYSILADVGWQFAAIHRPYSDPQWAMRKTGRYLHYQRNGSLPAAIIDPAGDNDSVGLSRTTDSEPWATYDLDSISWLPPGGVFWVDQADLVWVDDEA